MFEESPNNGVTMYTWQCHFMTYCGTRLVRSGEWATDILFGRNFRRTTLTAGCNAHETYSTTKCAVVLHDLPMGPRRYRLPDGSREQYACGFHKNMWRITVTEAIQPRWSSSRGDPVTLKFTFKGVRSQEKIKNRCCSINETRFPGALFVVFRVRPSKISMRLLRTTPKPTSSRVLCTH